MRRYLLACLWTISVAAVAVGEPPKDDPPKAADDRLVVELFAAAPDIVHPINMVCDARGRLLVIESHTHFRPPNYKGPKHDRIRILEDTKGTGKADRFTTFYEGTQATMDIALHPDGSIYLATRNEILRLRDTTGDGKADKKERIALLDTKGNYPHNGLCGLAFDSKGNLLFGMGENMGVPYKLIGSDGTTIGGHGEGGHVFWCTADGKKLRRVATGFWNPFGVCTDIFGRVFAVDNDPDAMPPCRLLHVVEGGDYGYQYRYGRSGRHPFQSWNGQLPGTLPMATGVGEAPCKILSYESDGLPREYVGDLLVASWADHRIERYAVKDKGATVVAERKPFIQGGKNFRPVGIAVAPDGSLYVSDWVLSNYELHGRGAIWHVRSGGVGKPPRPNEPRGALASAHRPLREWAARQLAQNEGAGRNFLRDQIWSRNLRVRAAAITALIDVGDKRLDLGFIATEQTVPALRAMVVRALIARGQDARPFLDKKQPANVRAEAVACLNAKSDLPRLLGLLDDADPFLRHAAVQQLARNPKLLAAVELDKIKEQTQRLGLFLARRDSGRPEALALVPRFLDDPDPEIRFLTAKWIADQKLDKFRPLVVAALKNPKLNVRLYLAYATALARIDNQDVNENRMADYFITRLADDQTPPTLRIALLRQIPANHKGLTLDLLARQLAHEDAGLRLEAIRALNEHPDRKRLPILLKTARNADYPERVRAEALVGLAAEAQEHVGIFLEFTGEKGGILRDEALRALVKIPLKPVQRKQFVGGSGEPLLSRALGKPFTNDRPRDDDLASWLKRLEGPADIDGGRRVFFHPRLAGCARCHRVDGRGQDIGPDLSGIGRTERRHILESILQPSNLVAPHYQAWSIETADGKVRTGMLMKTVLDEYTYADNQGGLFKVNTRDIVQSRALPTSVMPNGLADLLTDQEMRDLVAYLCSRK